MIRLFTAAAVSLCSAAAFAQVEPARAEPRERQPAERTERTPAERIERAERERFERADRIERAERPNPERPPRDPDARPVDPRRAEEQAARYRAAVGQVEAMRGYLDVVERYTRLSRDPAAAGIAAVVSTRDLLMPRGPNAVIEHFDKLLPEVRNDSVQRAIRLELVELYKQTNQPEKALETLRGMMTSVPPGLLPDAPQPRPTPTPTLRQ